MSERATALDAVLDAVLDDPAQRADFTRELKAAEILALLEGAPVPPESLVALRAAVAARKARPRPRGLTAARGIPSAAAAVVAGLLVWVGVQAGHRPTVYLPGAQQAAQSIQTITSKIAAVQQVVSTGDKPAAQTTALDARQALVQAQDTAVALPANDPYRDLLLQTAELKIQELEHLLAQLRLSVPPLPSVSSTAVQGPSSNSTPGSAPPAAGPSSTTTPSSTTSSTTTSTSASAPSTTTSSSQPGAPPLVTPIPTTSTTSSSTTTTSTSTTTTTTTNPPPPSTTSTTAPAR
jgi:hypothetical protein